MKLGSAHLTYCTNIHPGESWGEVRANLERHVVRVKAQIAPDVPFGVGLRLSARAATELLEGDALAELRAWLEARGLYVFTINGFPHGRFHGARVKENVYLPDWLEDERVRYTEDLARILAALLPGPEVGVASGSVSTVPGAFRPRATSPDARRRMADNMFRAARALARLEDTTGKRMQIAFEPEPYCHFETTPETVAFFEEELFARSALARFATWGGTDAAGAERWVRRHLGVCFDACHMAVEFEDAREGPRRLAAAGVDVAKVQLSAGLEAVVHPGAHETLGALERFADAVYFHQVVERRPARGAATGDEPLVRYLDLPEALAALRAEGEGEPRTWRVHFHVPLFLERLGVFANTQPYLRDLLALQREAPISQHLEVETYTWDVLPEAYRREDVVTAVARELTWVLEASRG